MASHQRLALSIGAASKFFLGKEGPRTLYHLQGDFVTPPPEFVHLSESEVWLLPGTELELDRSRTIESDQGDLQIVFATQTGAAPVHVLSNATGGGEADSSNTGEGGGDSADDGSDHSPDANADGGSPWGPGPAASVALCTVGLVSLFAGAGFFFAARRSKQSSTGNHVRLLSINGDQSS